MKYVIISLALVLFTQIHHLNIMHIQNQVDVGAATIVIIVLVLFVNSDVVFKTCMVCVTFRPWIEAPATLLNYV